MRVLLADDSAVSRAAIARMLASWGYEAVSCATGDEAWRILQGPDAPQLAVLDWVMPGLDGAEVCQRVRASRSERYVFVYLLTARDSQDDLLAGLEAGADDYLVKPVSPAELRVRLRNGRRVVELQQQLLHAREGLRAQAELDPLTSALNRRAFGELAAATLSSSCQAALVLADLDHFKSVNDTYGHRAGDAVLVETVRRLRSVLRAEDRVGRWGGEELAVLLPRCAPASAWAVAERLRREICKHPVVFEGNAITITASFGVAVATAGESPDALTERADQALYRAKRAGRNRTILGSSAGVRDVEPDAAPRRAPGAVEPPSTAR